MAKIDDSVKKKVPELRFKGFTDEWEERKFKDILKTHSFRSYLAGVSENGEYEVIQQGDKPIVGYSDGEPFTDYKDVTLFGDHTVSLYKPKSPFFVATDGVKILSADNFEGNYLYTTLERYKPEPQGYKRHFTILKNQDVWFTENMEEQQKIGSFFKQLDDTIALHQHKLDLLKEQKKGYLQKMFPKNGAKVPELRFAGFADDWEERKLGEISKMYQPLTITGNDLLPDGVPVFGANGFIGFFSEANHIDDQVTISARGEGTGTPSYVHGPVWITGNSMVVNVGDFDIDKYFLFANLTANSLKKYVTGGAQPQLTRDVLVKVPITLPNTDEQKKIGAFFKQFDDTITLHQRKLDLLKEQKKGFLQKMFV